MTPVERLPEPYEPAVSAPTDIEMRIVAAIRSLDHLGPVVKAHIVLAFSRMLAEDDPKFDADRFAAACTSGR